MGSTHFPVKPGQCSTSVWPRLLAIEATLRGLYAGYPASCRCPKPQPGSASSLNPWHGEAFSPQPRSSLPSGLSSLPPPQNYKWEPRARPCQDCCLLPCAFLQSCLEISGVGELTPVLTRIPASEPMACHVSYSSSPSSQRAPLDPRPQWEMSMCPRLALLWVPSKLHSQLSIGP